MAIDARVTTLVLAIVAMVGCSASVYAPVVTTSALGLHRTDLNDHPEYAPYILRPVRLASIDGTVWQLKKFDGGRYHVEISTRYNQKSIICDLGEGSMTITAIFDDSINGGIFYSATVFCQGNEFDAPLNHWSEDLKHSIILLN